MVQKQNAHAAQVRSVPWRVTDLFPIALSVGLALQGGEAFAQRASENAVTAAEDAFGGSVGRDSTGIYSESNIRGFSPQRAGNVRVDGLYFDQVAPQTGLLRAYSTMRVGYAAFDFPFPAPTGIVDNTYRTAGDKLVRSVSAELTYYNGSFEQFDLQAPLIKDHLSVVVGALHNYAPLVDGSSQNYYSVAVRPTLRFSRVQVSSFIGAAAVRDSLTRPIITSGAFLPPLTAAETYLGQDWATNKSNNSNSGVTALADLGAGFSARGGVFRSQVERARNYVERFAVADPSGLSTHTIVSDPRQEVNAVSWEGQLAWNHGGKDWRHRVIIGMRGRERRTESGGADSRNFGPVILGALDPEPEPSFTYREVNVGTVRQKHYMAGYFGQYRNVRVNLGLQKVQYDANFRSPTADVTASSADPWLYNINVRFDPTARVSLFASYVRGLEDSGTAPDTATNRNEYLPATLTEQIDGGARIRFGHTYLIASAFNLTKPYFTFNATNHFGEIGTERHRGMEFSLSGRPVERLQLVAGAVLLDAAVSGSNVATGLTGEHPVGTPSVYGRIDANYRTAVWGGLTPTMSVVYTGERAASAAPFAALGGEQLMAPGRVTLDIGARYAFKLGTTSLSLRATLANVFDDKAWRVVSSNTYQLDERRRFTMGVFADF